MIMSLRGSEARWIALLPSQMSGAQTQLENKSLSCLEDSLPHRGKTELAPEPGRFREWPKDVQGKDTHGSLRAVYKHTHRAFNRDGFFWLSPLRSPVLP